MLARLAFLLFCGLLLLLAACSSEPTPAPTILPAPTVPVVGEILAQPQPGAIQTIGLLVLSAEGALLTDGLSVSGARPQPVGPALIWLDQVPPLPPEPEPVRLGELSYLVVEARGILEGPGTFGPAGAYAYRLTSPTLISRSSRDLTIDLLLRNSALYSGQPIRLSGELLASPQSALLVERLGPGGVPADNARQIKLSDPLRDEAVRQQLTTSNDARIVFGSVEILGIWRNTTLYPLIIEVR
ncbi:MAG: hypothetical protein EOM24_07555 [Chloroflexia bacterium]|nr:hypothetical protein [Chloroflexia bacterium]